MNRNGKEDRDILIKANKKLKMEQKIKTQALLCKIKS
jgi:hypothetical protein